MPGEDIQSWSIVAADNANSDTSINWAEGQPRASVNNSARSMMAAHAKNRNLWNGSIMTGGTESTQTFTSGLGYTILLTGMRVLLKIGVGPNTGPVTLDMDSIGPVEIKKKTTGHPSLVAGELVLFGFYEFFYDGGNWLLLDAISETDVRGKVSVTGDTMTGPLVVNHNITCANLISNGGIAAVNAQVTGQLDVVSIVNSGTLKTNGILSHAGVNGPYGVSFYNFAWDNTGLAGFVDVTSLGYVSFTSDYRIKKDVQNLPRMWDTVKALRPIKYTQADFHPPAEVERAALGPMFQADEIERWGFIAHELQETMVASAATGVKDQPDLIQSPNPFTLIAALTKALQEAMARIEALEAA